MKGWLIYSKSDAKNNEAYIDWFINEGKKQAVTIRILYRELLQVGIVNNVETMLYDNKKISLPDFAVVRTIEPIVQHMFEAMDIPTFNSAHLSEVANHKARTYLEINKLGIPILTTFFTNKKSLPKHPPLPYPFVVKEATGRGGQQVHYISSAEEWSHTLNNLHAQDLIIQDTKVQLGRDLRVFVIGKEIIAAVLRQNNHDFRANYSLGGTAHIYSLSQAERSMIEKIINHFDFGLVGIDFLIGQDGELIFNEIEDVVGSRILSATTDINLLERYIDFIKNHVSQRSKK